MERNKTLILGWKKGGKLYVLDLNSKTRVKDLENVKFLPYKEVRL